MSTKIEIPINKTKAAIPILFLLFIGLCGVLAAISPETFVTKVSKYNSADTIRLLGISTAGLTFILSIVFIRKWMTKGTGLLIDKSGITDFSNATYNGLVEWNDITGIKEMKTGPIKSIVLLTNQPEKYINQAKKTARPTMSKALKFNGSPILIVSSRLKIKYEDLVDLIKTEFEKSRQ